MRLSINHTTGFRYDSPVAASYNEARIVPTSSDLQRVWSSRVTIEPAAWSFNYTDYWGTAVTTFELHDGHDRLTVRALNVVETYGDEADWDSDPDVVPDDLGWPALQEPGALGVMAEFLVVNDQTRAPEELQKLAREAADGLHPRAAALQVCRLIKERVRYERGSTTVNTTAEEVWTGGAGVCQDFTHLALGALRSIGLPARYVSGYLLPDQGEAAQPNVKIAGESHSWIEWWCGSWVAFDPTSLSRITENYVRVGHGRDYFDVAPLRGTYSGGHSEMFVTVEITQLG